MELKTTDNQSKYEIYKSLILKRDKLKKLAFEYRESYYRTFGDLLKQSYQIKIECIELKKRINYCQMRLNRNEPILKTELDQYIETVMQEYYDELEKLIHHVQAAKDATSISLRDVQKIKKIYRYIAKKIHPDLHPELFEKEEVKELWNQTVIAYECNNLEELEELKILVDELCEEQENIEIDRIDEKIEKIQAQIDKIQGTEPYIFKYILENLDEIQSTKDELNEEIEAYKKYKSQLESIFSTFDIKHYYS